MVFQPPVPNVADSRPARSITGDLQNEQLVVYADVCLQLVSQLFWSFIGPDNPNCVQVVPPSAQRLYRVDKVVVRRAFCGMDIVGNEYRGPVLGFYQLLERLMLWHVSGRKKAFNFLI
jgi:hypothetical protein